MSAKDTALLSTWTLAMLVNGAAFGQRAGAPRTVPRVTAVSTAPIVTILAAAAGALVRAQAAGDASLDLGRVSCFRGTSAPGERSRRISGSFVISTRFALRVDCPGSSSSSRVKVTMSRLDAASSYGIAIDGTTLGTAARTLAQSMPCGSLGEHGLDVEVPVSAPAGSIESNVAFAATLQR